MSDGPGWHLKEWRRDRGYSLERLAEMVGTSRGHLSDLERGVRRYNQDILEQLAIALNTTPADIIRRRPTDPEAIETKGLTPEQVSIVRGVVDQMRKAG